MYKCDHSGQDIELALLSLRSTPLDSNLPSPAELLNRRKYRTTMPSVNHSSSAATNSDIRNQLESRQQTSKGYYDQHTREKSELLANQSVWVRNNETRRWEPAYVIKKADTPRSYIVQRCPGGVPLRRNRQHIRPASEQWNAEDMEKDVLDDIDFRIDAQLRNQEMVGSEPSLRPVTLDEDSSSIAASSQTESRYPKRRRVSPDFYQAGT